MKSILTLGITVLAACSFSLSAYAQQEEPKKDNDPLYNFSPAMEFLRSTHGNFFNGPSFKVTRNFSGGFKPGIGIAYATTSTHFDNGLILYKMKMLPVYANLTYDIPTKSKFEPFVETSVGMTFFNYDQATDADPNTSFHVKEHGLYIYGGLGLRYAVSKRFAPYVSTGFKSYNVTTNDLDINPHGISFQVGLRF